MSYWEDWTREFSDFLEQTARTTEQWAEQTLQTAVEAADTLADEVEKQVSPALGQWVEDWYRAVEPLETVLDEEADRLSAEISTWMTPLVVPLADALETWVEAFTAPLNNTIEPLVNEHSACVGCRHYYGQAHGGHMLVCAMYPYGPDLEKCPDWASVWNQSDSNE